MVISDECGGIGDRAASIRIGCKVEPASEKHRQAEKEHCDKQQISHLVCSWNILKYDPQ